MQCFFILFCSIFINFVLLCVFNIHIFRVQVNFYLSFIAIVSGFGFGVISGAFSLVNVLADMTGPGTVGIYGDSANFFITSGDTK